MNLEKLKNELGEIASSIDYNNSNHYQLNEKLLSESSALESCNKEQVPCHKEGLMVELKDVIQYLRRLSENQRLNVERTTELVKGVEVEIPLPVEYQTR